MKLPRRGLLLEKAGYFYEGGLFWFSGVKQGGILGKVTIAWLTRWLVKALAH
jgi:hypothetical protein